MFGNELDLIIPAVCFLVFLIGIALHHERVRTPRARRELLDISYREPLRGVVYDREHDAA